jgi:dephospho-CoA kinase
VVVITAPQKLREARARVPLAGRTERLLPDIEKVDRADYSYVNTGSLEDLDAFIVTVMEELRALPEPPPG